MSVSDGFHVGNGFKETVAPTWAALEDESGGNKLAGVAVALLCPSPDLLALVELFDDGLVYKPLEHLPAAALRHPPVIWIEVLRLQQRVELALGRRPLRLPRLVIGLRRRQTALDLAAVGEARPHQRAAQHVARDGERAVRGPHVLLAHLQRQHLHQLVEVEVVEAEGALDGEPAREPRVAVAEQRLHLVLVAGQDDAAVFAERALHLGHERVDDARLERVLVVAAGGVAAAAAAVQHVRLVDDEHLAGRGGEDAAGVGLRFPDAGPDEIGRVLEHDCGVEKLARV